MKEEIKTLSTCTDIEFLQQTNKIRHAIKEWLDVTVIMKIYRRTADIEEIPVGDEAKAEVIREKNKKLIRNQFMKNLDEILDSILEKHPEETLKVLRLCCFVDPDDDSHKVTYYLGAFSQMMGDQDVIDFFTSLINLGQTFGFEA